MRLFYVIFNTVMLKYPGGQRWSYRWTSRAVEFWYQMV